MVRGVVLRWKLGLGVALGSGGRVVVRRWGGVEAVVMRVEVWRPLGREVLVHRVWWRRSEPWRDQCLHHLLEFQISLRRERQVKTSLSEVQPNCPLELII